MKIAKTIAVQELENFMIMNPMAVFLDLRDVYIFEQNGIDGFININYKDGYETILSTYHRDQKLVITAMTEQKQNIMAEKLLKYGYNHIYLIDGNL